MGKYSGRSTPAEFVAGLLKQRGFTVDPLRLEEKAAAEKERRKIDGAQHLDSVRAKASAAKRARRACELEEWAWRQNPSSDNLARARAAQAARKHAEDELLEACSFDRDLMRDVLRQA